jgi:hypothetical protein
MPPTGSSGLPWRWRFRPQVHAGRVRHPDGQTDRRPHRRGRAVGTPAGTIRMPPVSRSGSRAADGHQSRIIQQARTRQARARECRGGTGCRSPGRQGAGRCGRPDRPSSYSGITLSDEGGLKKTHATRRAALERSLRSDPLEVSRSVSSAALLNLRMKCAAVESAACPPSSCASSLRARTSPRL